MGGDGGGGSRFLNFKVPIGSPQDELVTEGRVAGRGIRLRKTF